MDILTRQQSAATCDPPLQLPRVAAGASIAIDYANKLGMAYELQPNSTVRKVIAKRLTESKQTVPHFLSHGGL